MDKEELKEKTENITNTDSKSDEENKVKEELSQKDGEESSDVEIKEEEKKLTPEEEIETLKDKLARTFAEMENQRRRFEKEKDDAYEYGGYSFAKEALNLLDNLERSKAALENDDNLKNTEALKKIVDHLNIINDDMLSIFKKNNIEPIKSIDQKLDPNLHQAMMEIEDDSKEPGTIVQEIQKGFMMKDRLLRPSLVGVSKRKVEEIHKNEQKDEKSQ